MTSFSSLLSSISGQPPAPQPRPQSNGQKPPLRAPASLDAPKRSNEATLVANNAAAGVKRRSSDNAPSAPAKLARVTPVGSDRRPPAQPGQNATAAKPTTGVNPPATAYRGTARPAGPTNASKVVARPVSKPAQATAPTSSTTAAAPGAAAPAKQKRGFAALMEKAKASQEASKVAATTGIQHKPISKLNRREREKMQKEAAMQQLKAKKQAGRPGATDRSRNDHVVETKPAVAKKAQETSYKGTMKKAPTELTYKGTMRPVGAAPSAPKPAVKKGMGQDRYGGYASWSDLDDVEDDEEDDYESDVSSDMEGGFGDVEREEFAALRVAKQEDQAALEEEDRLKREKLERKKRLLALNKSAAAKRRM